MRQRILRENWRFFAVDAPELTGANGIPAPVPGSWRDLPGLREYKGRGRYVTVFTPEPEPGECRMFVHFGGVFRRAEVCLNGETVGNHNGFQAPFGFELTSLLRPGENSLEVTVASDRPKGELFGSGSVPEGVPFPLDGITQPVRLWYAGAVFATEVYTPVDLQRGEALLQTAVQNGLTGDLPAEVRFTLELPGHPERSISHAQRATLQPGENMLRTAIPLESIALWSPDSPALYRVTAEVIAGDGRDVFSCQTGFCSFAVKGKDFVLNGKPIYLCGYGDDWVYPEKGPSADDPAFYEAGLRRAKEYGFIFARHHSHFPFEAALEACDRVGMLIQPELALANVSRERFTPENSALYLAQWRELIRAYRHHPCIAAWCGGNEMEWGFPFSRELYDTAKRLDPYRPVTTTDGNFMACDVEDTQDYAGIVPGEYTDYLPYRELGDLFTRDDCGKPQVVHEMGNYATLFDIRSAGRWETCAYPNRRVAAMRERVEQGKARELYAKALQSSFDLQKLCYKLNIEKIRLAPAFGGYHLWTLTDYYETTQGLLSSFYEDKAFTAEEFAKLNAQDLLLWDTPTCVFSAGETVTLSFALSRYSGDLPEEATLTAALCGAEERRSVRLSGHGLLPLGQWTLTLPLAEREEEHTLRLRLETASGVLENQWSLFSVPRIGIRREKEIYIHYLSRHLLERDGTPARHFTVPQPIGSDQLVVTDRLYGGMTRAVEEGAAMLLLARPETFRHTVCRNSFKSPWWDPGEIWYVNHTNNRQIAGVIENCPATAMLPYSGGWKLDLFGAVEQAVAVDLDAAGLDVEPLIYGVDEQLHRLGYLFQFRLGKGKVLVCTMNHERSDLQDPAVDYLLRSLINYCMSEAFAPEKTLDADGFRGALQK